MLKHKVAVASHGSVVAMLAPLRPGRNVPAAAPLCRLRETSVKMCVPLQQRPRTMLVRAVAAADAPPQPHAEDRPKATQLTTAEFARTMMELAEEGSLSTIQAATGFPLGTHVAFVLDASGRPVLELPSHSIGLENLKANPNCSLHIQVELPGLQKPQITVCGRAAPPEDAPAAMRYELAWSRRYGTDDDQGGDERELWLLDVDGLLVANNVDQAPVWIAAEDFFAADPDPLRDVGRKIVEDVNREHWQDLRRFPLAFAGINDDVEDASLIWVDRLGMDLRAWLTAEGAGGQRFTEIRIPFAREAADEREARSAITMMAQVSWEKERNYTPQMPNMVPTPLAEQ